MTDGCGYRRGVTGFCVTMPSTRERVWRQPFSGGLGCLVALLSRIDVVTAVRGSRPAVLKLWPPELEFVTLSYWMVDCGIGNGSATAGR